MNPLGFYHFITMGASESSDRYIPSSTPHNQVVSRREEPDEFRVLRLQTERREIQIGGQRVEAQRINVVGASGSGNHLRIHQQEHVEVRMQVRGGDRGLGWRDPQPRLMLCDSSDDEDSGKCTYDDDGPGFFLQPWFKCYTCWGSDADESSFGCCLHCANTCHHGHRLQRCGLQKAECDCGQYKHQAAVCTWHVTKRNYVKQPFYRCFDCFSEPNSGVCYQCWKICHRTHNTSYSGVMPAFCDCGLSCCRIKCTIPAPK